MRTRYPGIWRATLAISYDNGGVNRDRTEEDVEKALAEVLGAEGVDEKDLQPIDAWLGQLSEEALDIVCCGEERDMQAALTSAPPLTAGLLNDIFEHAA